MRTSILALYLSVLSITAFAQTATIYQVLKLTPGGCALSRISYSEQLESTVEFNPPFSPERNDRVSLTDIMAHAQPFFKAATHPCQPPVITLGNGNVLFVEKGRYGLKTAAGKVIIPASFLSVVPDGKNGFVGYGREWCNYYSQDGKKLFSKDYYSIEPTGIHTFIVQTAKGYGVADALQKEIIKPGYSRIKLLSAKGQNYYKVYGEEDVTFYLSQNLRDTLWVAGIEGIDPLILSARYWYVAGNIIDVKAKKRLFCEDSYYIEILDAEQQLAITQDRQGFKYLFNFSGQLLTNTKFRSIYGFEKNGLGLASVQINQGDLWGVINANGKWAIQPTYKEISFIDNRLIAATRTDGKSGIIDIHGKVLLPFKYTRISAASDTLLLATVETKDAVLSDLVSKRDFKVIKSGLPYRSIRKSELCGGSAYEVTLQNGESLLDANFRPIPKKVYSRIFYGPEKQGFIATDFGPGNSRSTSTLYSCDGHIEQFKIEGNTYNIFDNYINLDKDISHLLLPNGKGYFVLSNGTTVANDSHWQAIDPANCNDMFRTMVYGGKYGYINNKGETVIPPIFEYVGTFDAATGLAVYNFDNVQRGYITTDGTLLFGTTYKECEFLGNGLFKVTKDGELWGVVNRENDVIVPLKFGHVFLDGGIIQGSGNSRLSRTGQSIN